MLACDGDSIWTLKRHLQPLLRGPGVSLAAWNQFYLQKQTQIRTHWNLKNPFMNSCFNWMTRNRYIGIVCFTKNPFLTGCLGFQVHSTRYIVSSTSDA